MEPHWQTEDGAIRLYCADCLDVLPTLSGVDAVVVDPPYGIAHESHGSLFVGFDGIAGDDSTATAQTIRAVSHKLQACCVMFFSPYRPLSGFRSVLCWDKGAHVGIGGDRATCWKRDFELIGIEGNRPLIGQRDSAVVRINALSPPPSGHAHEKPLALMRYLIGKIDADTVCDPCMGSGTTGVACVRLGRRFIGIEKERRYFEIAKKRIQNELEKTRLFEPPPKIVQRSLLSDKE